MVDVSDVSDHEDDVRGLKRDITFVVGNLRYAGTPRGRKLARKAELLEAQVSAYDKMHKAEGQHERNVCAPYDTKALISHFRLINYFALTPTR